MFSLLCLPLILSFQATSVDKIEGLPENVFDASSPVDSQFLEEIALVRSQLELVRNRSGQLLDNDGVLCLCAAVFVNQ